MRPSRTVARAALSAVLALGALPGLVGSHEPSQDRPIDAASFGQIFLATTQDRQGSGDTRLRRRWSVRRRPRRPRSAERARSRRSGRARRTGTATRAEPRLPSRSWKQPRYTISGFASFYDNGTTAMRDVPRGTTIVICGAGGCIETVVTDYGPAKSSGRIIDMYRPDFFRICGCGSWSGHDDGEHPRLLNPGAGRRAGRYTRVRPSRPGHASRRMAQRGREVAR